MKIVHLSPADRILFRCVLSLVAMHVYRMTHHQWHTDTGTEVDGPANFLIGMKLRC